MDVTLLRTLTRKSLLKFGQYQDMMVGNVIKIGQAEIEYLVWIYYNSSKINFTDDILLELKITDEFKIDKPGKKPEMLKIWKLSLSSSENYESIESKKRKFRSKSGLQSFTDGRKFNRKAMMKRNHGHKI